MPNLTEEQKQNAIDTYASKGNLVDAAAACGVCVRTLFNERRDKAAFRKEMEISKELYCEEIRRKMHNLTEDKEAKNPQFLAIMAQARAHMRDYRDTVDHKVTADIKVISAVPRPE